MSWRKAVRNASLHDRCEAFLNAAQLETAVDDLHDFVLAEVGRLADTRLDTHLPLVLYFRNEDDMRMVIEAVAQGEPGMITRRWPR